MSSLRLSFEFFPPKDQEGVARLSETATLLANSSQPHFFSVTFGAGGSTRSGTLETVKRLQQQVTVPIAPHLSCIGSDREALLDIIQHYQAMGVNRIVALRGDLPSGMAESGEFKFASELVALIRAATGDHFHIDVAAYPDIHPQARSVKDDLLNLKKKQEAGANSAITQYFFNPDAYFYYRDDCYRYGIDMPIVPGIMPITEFHALARFSDRCGAEIPCWIRKRLESDGEDSHAIQQFGLEVVHHLCQRLIEGGVPGLHFYTLNKGSCSLEVLGQLGLTGSAVTEHAIQW